MSQLKKKFKALIIDCDGTLIANSRDALPTLFVTETILKASNLMHIGIATQRSLLSSRPIIEHLKLTGPSIIHGGAQVIDSQTFKILHEELIEIDDLYKAIKIIKKFKNKYNLSYLIQDGKGKDKEGNESYVPREPMVVYIPELKEEIADDLRSELSAISNLSAYKFLHWDNQFSVVITSAKATKQHGIFEVAKILDIDTKEIIGIGDGYNDFPLLMACGLKVAMGNAVEDLKAIADYIAPSVEEDGVAEVINKFILA